MSETPMETASQFIYGLQISSMFSVDLFRSAMNYKPRPDDIFIATYPKCGTTWAQHILLLIFRQGKPIESLISYMMETPHIELTGKLTWFFWLILIMLLDPALTVPRCLIFYVVLHFNNLNSLKRT
ncbi:hypothetical protein AVEN_53236-1 [Araneus ventricosus]|uniref:Sulfotransferase domain-containing protein n=1 Tax=Araneus ventricosus TaxID=182803 RepID=A0A4Y2A9J9_ARAVE|nr:hypothetical protein AVEN_53236-1 [Araneus ventricosus]